MVAGVALGAVPVPAGDVVAAIGRALRGVSGGLADTLIVDVRLPRVVLAALVGAALAARGRAVPGALPQPARRSLHPRHLERRGSRRDDRDRRHRRRDRVRFAAVPLAAFVGATLTMLLVVRLATYRGRLDATSLLLAGVALSYTLAAVTSFLMVVVARADGIDRLLDDGRVLGGVVALRLDDRADVPCRHHLPAAHDARAQPHAARRRACGPSRAVGRALQAAHARFGVAADGRGGRGRRARSASWG